MHPRWLRCSSLKYCPIFSVVAPCHRGASPASVRRRDFHHGLLGGLARSELIRHRDQLPESTNGLQSRQRSSCRPSGELTKGKKPTEPVTLISARTRRSGWCAWLELNQRPFD